MKKIVNRKSFQRLVLLSEDTYRNALSCMAKDAFEKATDETQWYEKDSSSGKVQKINLPLENRVKLPAVTDASSSIAISTVPTPTIAEPINVSVQTDSHQQELSSVAEADASNSNYKPLSANRKGIPATFRKKYDLLLEKLKSTNRYHVDSKGQLVLPDGHVIAGSNFHELFRYMFSSVSASKRPVGFEPFVLQLRSEGILPSEVTSNDTKQVLQVGKGAIVRNSHFVSPPPGKRARILHVY
jgi:hypothetical protein